MSSKKNKIIVILGPTASGKTKLAVELAYKFNGEIVSADSRQVYKYMDIGTGKDLCEYNIKNKKIPYHCINIVHPNTEFNLAKFQKKTNKAIKDILKRNKLPIIVGGSGLYLQAIVDGYDLSHFGVDKKIREKLEKLNISQLLKKIQKLNYNFSLKINKSDIKNKRRLIRYVEILSNSKILKNKKNKNYDFILIGLKFSKEILRKRIYKRLIERLEKENMVKEVEILHKKYRVSWKRLESFGLEYKYISLYLRKKINYDEMTERLNIAIRQFAKKQISWFKRWEKQGIKINWIKRDCRPKKIINLIN